ncbi:MAG: AraC family transcriptional regulator [Muribaculaceae bacterium]|nr:AraC family transcriptional regulator [Muribaculaceae bacterium]
MEKEVDLSQVIALEKYSREFSNLGCDYVFSRLGAGKRPFETERGPIRVKGMTIMLCLKGRIDVEVNLTEYTIEPNMLLVIGHDSIFSVKGIDYDNLDAYLLVISPGFLRDINIDTSVLQTIKFTPNAVPIMPLSESEMELTRKYFDLVHSNTSHNREPLYVRNISRCILAALVYQFMQFGRDRSKKSDDAPQSRRTNYVKQFIALVHQYYREQRSVAFYAEKLFISPKYLSMLVKEASGKSAAEWIDEYVILEAKNLLRFSGLNIQQVAFTLHFSNQSTFGKYFKHLTGMSPTEFQRS